MNVTNIIKIATEIKELRDRADKLEEQLAKEVNKAKSVFPTDYTKKQEVHSGKYSRNPWESLPHPLEPIWLGGYPTVHACTNVREL